MALHPQSFWADGTPKAPIINHYGALHPSEFGNDEGKITIDMPYEGRDIKIIGNTRLAALALIDYAMSFYEKHRSWNMISFEMAPFVFCFVPIIKIKKNTFSILAPEIESFIDEVNKILEMKAFL